MNRSGVAPIPLIITIAVVAAVGGYLVFAPEVQVSPTIPQGGTPAPVASFEETADWQTYRNEQYGFEMRYPAFYRASEESSLKKVRFFHERSAELFLPGATIEVMEESVDSVVQKLKNRDPGITRVVEEKDVVISGQSAKKLVLTTAVGFDDISYLLVKGNLTFLLNGLQSQEQILSTFKFIEPGSSVDTSTWKTYRSEDWGFEVKYPREWNVSAGSVKPADRFVSATAVQLYPVTNCKEFCPSFFVSIVRQPFEVSGEVYRTAESFARAWYRDAVDIEIIPAQFETGEGVKVVGKQRSELTQYLDPFESLVGFRGEIVVLVGYGPVWVSDYQLNFRAMVDTFKFISQ